jgi:Zn-dependent peptidase ImmA (M78 family)/transcriptional regulator with XRE-family HTH domain
MPVTQETIGHRLREARLNVRISQEEAAESLGLDRTAVVKIEKGTRAVSTLELVRLAALYHRDLSELLSEEPLAEDPFTLLGRITGNEDPPAHGPVGKAIGLLKEAVRLETFLGDRLRSNPPAYQFPAPQNYDDANEQGKELATLERRRLGLGSGAIADVAEVIAAQEVWTAAIPLPEEVSGLFVAHPRYGLTIFVNQRNWRARRRFSYAHEYAHALVDRNQPPEPSSAANAKTFKEKRGNAFASEFLMPAEGVWEALERMRKGGASRASSWTYDIFSDRYEHDEVRLDPTAQRIGLHDVVFLASEFRVSYEMAAIRLKDIGVIRKPALDELLERKDDARSLMKALSLCDAKMEDNQPYLVRQVMALAIEALRRDKISRGRFVDACALAGTDPERMLGIASRA